MDLNKIEEDLIKKAFQASQKERESFLDRLEKKYCSNQDESDIIDLETMTIVEDNGALRKMKKPKVFGSACKTYSCRESRKATYKLKKILKVRKKHNISAQGSCIITEVKIVEEIKAVLGSTENRYDSGYGGGPCGSGGYSGSYDSQPSTWNTDIFGEVKNSGESSQDTVENFRPLNETFVVEKDHTLQNVGTIPAVDYALSKGEISVAERQTYVLEELISNGRFSERKKQTLDTLYNLPVDDLSRSNLSAMTPIEGIKDFKLSLSKTLHEHLHLASGTLWNGVLHNKQEITVSRGFQKNKFSRSKIASIKEALGKTPVDDINTVLSKKCKSFSVQSHRMCKITTRKTCLSLGDVRNGPSSLQAASDLSIKNNNDYCAEEKETAALPRNQENRKKLENLEKNPEFQNGTPIPISRYPTEKGYSCPFCPYKSIQYTNVKHHIRMHTGECPFSCQICLKSFTRKGSLQRHMLNTHEQFE